MDDSQYRKLCAKHDEKCPICETIGVGLVIDHDHATGQNRGLLCLNCNLGLGYFVDSLESLEGAIVYLTEHDSLDTNVDTSVAPSDYVIPPVATPVRRPAVVAANVPPLEAYDKVRRYSKDGKTCYDYKYFPDSTTDDQIRAHVTPNKKCSRCGETVNSSNFHMNRNSVDGLYSYCLECCKIQKRLTKYGIDDPQYRRLCAKHDETCPICDKDDVGLVVDHDHATKQVRGLLCGNCNLGLGHFVDCIEVLNGAIVYLTEHEQRGVCVTETL
jgi:hypothetical protein